MINQNTVIEQLSSTLFKSLSFLESPEFENIKNDMSSLTHTVTSLEQEVTSMLSAIPLHPYERLKYDYFGPDYTFKTFNDLEEEVDDHLQQKCTEYLKMKSNELISTTFHNLTCCEEDRCCTAFAINSGGRLIPDHTRQKNYIEFLEIVKSIPIDSVNDENSASISKKLINHYMKII